MASDNRDRVVAQPLGWSRKLAIHKYRHIPRPRGAEVVAEMDGGIGSNTLGWMLRLPGGSLVYQELTGGFKVLDQRKAEAALAVAESRVARRNAGLGIEAEETQEEALGRQLKDWRGDRSRQDAAGLLGIPVRTLDHVESGRGFRYPQLLLIAMKAVGNDAS